MNQLLRLRMTPRELQSKAPVVDKGTTTRLALLWYISHRYISRWNRRRPRYRRGRPYDRHAGDKEGTAGRRTLARRNFDGGAECNRPTVQPSSEICHHRCSAVNLRTMYEESPPPYPLHLSLKTMDEASIRVLCRRIPDKFVAGGRCCGSSGRDQAECLHKTGSRSGRRVDMK